MWLCFESNQVPLHSHYDTHAELRLHFCGGVKKFDDAANLCWRKSLTERTLSLCLTLYECSPHAIDVRRLQRRMHVEQVGYKG